MFPCTPESFCQEVDMALDDPKMKFILVEGSTDWTVFIKIFPPKFVRYFELGQDENNKQMNIDTITILAKEKEKRKKLMGIVDADFDLVETPNNKIRNNSLDFQERCNIFRTDYHDLDVQIISSTAFNHFINSDFFEPFKIDIDKILEICIQVATQFGYVRLFFHDQKVRINEYNEFIKNIEDYVDENNYEFLTEKLENDLKDFFIFNDANCEEEFLKYQNFKKEIKTRLGKDEIFDIPNGHDVYRVLTKLILHGSNQKEINIRKKYLTPSSKKYKIRNEFDNYSNEIEQQLRNHYNLDLFFDSDLYEKNKETMDRFF
jgi:hypothetical protein